LYVRSHFIRKKEPKSASRRLNKLKKRVLKNFLDEILNYRSPGPEPGPNKKVTGTWIGTKKSWSRTYLMSKYNHLIEIAPPDTGNLISSGYGIKNNTTNERENMLKGERSYLSAHLLFSFFLYTLIPIIAKTAFRLTYKLYQVVKSNKTIHKREPNRSIYCQLFTTAELYFGCILCVSLNVTSQSFVQKRNISVNSLV
jgi:hypothetical protein